MSFETETAARAAVIARARAYIGTPYHAGADILGVGVDCGMLILRAFVDCGLAPPFDPRPYSPDWHLHRSDEVYLSLVSAYCGEVASPKPGDVALFKWGRCYSHGGLVSEASPLAVIHAYQPAGLVLEERIDLNIRLAEPERAPRFFSLWAKRRRS